jgi:L-threonylcarbamoyladenylate synthase
MNVKESLTPRLDNTKMTPGETAVWPGEDGVAAAAACLARGGLVAFPTETVYGLGADARDPRAVARIFAAKNRPAFNPLIVHVGDAAMAARLGRFSDRARALAEAFWPGPLTLVLPLRPDSGLADLVTSGLAHVGLRLPAHPLARDLLSAFGGPVAAPSANPSGRVSPTTATHVIEGLAGRIDGIIDGGSCPVGLESTIIGFDGETPLLLRPGGLPVEAIAACLGEAPQAPPRGPVTAPGQLASHYAPAAALRLEAETCLPGELWLGFGHGGPAGMNLSPSGDLVEAAANLFAMLRALDAQSGRHGRIAVARIPRHGLGLAINDRLLRAAAPRSGPPA